MLERETVCVAGIITPRVVAVAIENRVTVIALGENKSAAPNATPDGADFEEGRRKNRRAEIEIQPVPAIAATPAETENPDQPPRA